MYKNRFSNYQFWHNAKLYKQIKLNPIFDITFIINNHIYALKWLITHSFNHQFQTIQKQTLDKTLSNLIFIIIIDYYTIILCKKNNNFHEFQKQYDHDNKINHKNIKETTTSVWANTIFVKYSPAVQYNYSQTKSIFKAKCKYNFSTNS